MIEISNFALASLLPRPLLPIAWLEERENWISKTQSEMVSCGGDEDLHFKQIGTHHSPELLLESDIPSLVWVHYILTFSIGNMLPEPSLPTTCSSALFAEQKISFYNKFLYPSLLLSWTEGKRARNIISFSVKRNLYLWKWPGLTTVNFDRQYWGPPIVPNLSPETSRDLQRPRDKII